MLSLVVRFVMLLFLGFEVGADEELVAFFDDKSQDNGI